MSAQIPLSHGPDLPEPADPIPFATDDTLADRLRQAHDGATHLEYAAGCLKRELGELHRLVAPRDAKGLVNTA